MCAVAASCFISTHRAFPPLPASSYTLNLLMLDGDACPESPENIIAVLAVLQFPHDKFFVFLVTLHKT